MSYGRHVKPSAYSALRDDADALQVVIYVDVDD